MAALMVDRDIRISRPVGIELFGRIEGSGPAVVLVHGVGADLGSWDRVTERLRDRFTVVDLRSYWQVNDKWLLSAGVENVGDRAYREHLDPISGNLLGVDPLFRPGANFYFASQFTY